MNIYKLTQFLPTLKSPLESRIPTPQKEHIASATFPCAPFQGFPKFATEQQKQMFHWALFQGTSKFST